jgi:hypothetical protein
MSRTTRISMDYMEMRRDRRYFAPPVTVSFGGTQFTARNWSLGGVLIDGGPPVTVGSEVPGKLALVGQESSYDVVVEPLRRDPDDGTLACRFVAPSPVMVDALDRAVVRRMLGRRDGARRMAVALAFAGGLLAALPALAGSPSGSLVPGNAPLPEFRLNFPRDLDATAGANGDYVISLTSPDQGVMHFLFSPRPQFNSSLDRDTGTSRSSAGLSWNLFESGGFFGNLGIAGSFTRPGLLDLDNRALGPSFALHGNFEIGYQLGNQHSLTLSLDHPTSPDYQNEHGELNNLRLRYGLKF